MIDRRQALILGTSLWATAAASHWATPRTRMSDSRPMPALDRLLPSRTWPWQQEAQAPHLLVSPDVKAVLDRLYQQTLTRIYRLPGHAPVMLAMAYGGDQSDATKAHRPEVCYPAQGFSVSGSHKTWLELASEGSITRLPIRRLIARLQSRHEPLSYWITVGEQVATDGWEQKLAQMRYGLQGLIPDGLLVRVSTIDRDRARAWSTQARFVADWHAHLGLQERQRVFGQTPLIAGRGTGAADD